MLCASLPFKFITVKNTITKLKTKAENNNGFQGLSLAVFSCYLIIMTFLACKVTFKIMFLHKSVSKLVTKIYDLATKFFPLVTSWHQSKKVNF